SFPAELEEELNCSICLNTYKNPILLSCGHNFCKHCIEDVWESQAAKGTYSPETVNILERLLPTQVMEKQATVYCTFCLETALPAIKTCLQCETSLCESHLRKHNDSVNHTIIEPTSSLEDRKCPDHKELIKYYCTDDDTCVCVTCCVAGKHKTHNVETVAEVAEKRKEELASSHQTLLHQTKDIEQTLQQLQEHLRFIDAAALAEREKMITFYSEIKKLLEAAERKSLDAIDAERKRVLDKVTNQITELEMSKDNILLKIQEIKGLRDISDPVDFLKKFKHMAMYTEEEDEDSWDENSGDVNKDDNDSEEVIEWQASTEEEDNDDCDEKNGGGKDDGDDEEEPEGLIKENFDEQMISLLKQMTLNKFVETLYDVQEDSHLSFDTETMHRNVILSEFLKKATYVEDEQGYPGNLRRFLNVSQVMCSQSFSAGRYFWEFEVSAEGDWSVGLAYNSIERDGDDSTIRNNSVSWCLYNINNEFSALYNRDTATLKKESAAPKKLGMYLDYEAGVLSFYDLTDTLTHLHTFTCIFTEPVYPVCYVCNSGWIQIKS
uniref:Tripartite motif containing 25 n=1 Tax=Latimeria chalumnae TaxID=7897 RepID=H2ZU01_LATCH